jgi:hypothetical protein
MESNNNNNKIYYSIHHLLGQATPALPLEAFLQYIKREYV